MADKKRWTDPANDGQPDLIKMGIRMFYLIMLLMAATLVRMAINNHWLDSFLQLVV
jgi:hypothetical protein